MNDWKGIALFVVIILICVFAFGGCLKSEENEIGEWVKARGERVIEVDYRILDIGPYWYMKEARFYYVKTDKNVYWVKYMFGRTINQEVNGKYVELE